MEKIFYSLRIFFLYSKLGLKKSLQEHASIIFFTIGKVLRFILFFLFAYFLVSKSRLLKGYNIDHVIFFYLTFTIIDTASQFLFREVYRFRWRLVSGEFDGVLVKPHHPFLRVLVGGVDLLDLALLIPYLLLTVFFALKLGTLTPTHTALYVGLLLSSFIIATSFHIAVLAFGLLTTEVDQTLWIYRDVTGLGRFPFEIYKEPVRSIFTFIVPVGVMMSFPAKALFGLLSLTLIFYSFLTSFFLLISSLLFWNFAIKKYQSWGG